MSWKPKDAAELYGTNYWSSDYFTVSDKGEVLVTPRGKDGPQLSLKQLVDELVERGIRPPINIRFQDILDSRVRLLADCFDRAINEYGYRGAYRGVYPIKVNQQRFVVRELVRYGRSRHLGLEAGSKPELLVVLSQVRQLDTLIVCNGFKDSHYIETALLAKKLGYNIVIVVDRFAEIEMIIQATRKINVDTKIGFRAKLNTKSGGKWVESSGNQSKFGLTAVEMVEGVKRLQADNMLDSLCLLHYHIGSQVPSIKYIKSALKEGARYYTELFKLGAKMEYLDVGGGLGVDYDGSGKSDNSTNYSEQEYANDVVSVIQDICDENSVPHPHIVTEAGRALTAHHSMLITNVMGRNSYRCSTDVSAPDKVSHSVIENLLYISQNLKKENLNESYNDIMQLHTEVQQLFTFGVLNLEQRATAERIFWSVCTRLEEMAKDDEEAEDILHSLQEELSDLLYCNFSVFQSIPDSWALKQVFPVMPIHRLEEEPTRLATIADLTCDSDGKMDMFIDTEEWENRKTLPVHESRDDEPYYLGIFLTGAYQEILGDLHNLFGDSDSVNVTVTNRGYSVEHVVRGDTVGEILGYLEYPREPMLDRLRRRSEEAMLDGRVSKSEARQLMRNFEDGLNGYTYLEDLEE